MAFPELVAGAKEQIQTEIVEPLKEQAERRIELVRKVAPGLSKRQAFVVAVAAGVAMNILVDQALRRVGRGLVSKKRKRRWRGSRARRTSR